jgi:hypothetical protein
MGHAYVTMRAYKCRVQLIAGCMQPDGGGVGAGVGSGVGEQALQTS